MNGLKSMSVGFSQWQAPSLLNQFYPDDLPEDWRADYYFNYFRVAMASQQEWMSWDAGVIDMINEAMLAENFFYLAWSELDEASLNKFQQLREALGEKLAGLLLSGSWTPDLMAENQSDFDGLAVTLMQPKESPWLLSGWDWHYNEQCFSGAPLALFDKLPESLKEQRQVIESFKHSLPSTSAVPIFVNADHVTTKQLTDLSSMIELLGY